MRRACAEAAPLVLSLGAAVNPWLVGGVLAAAFALIGLAVWLSWRASPKWLKLPSGNRYLAPEGFPPERLQHALMLAAQMLRAHTTFPPIAIDTVVTRVSVLVARDNSWVDGAERRIGGFAQPELFSVAVGYDLSALFHELAHVLEWYVHGAADDAHSRWAERGVHAGDEAYRRALS